MRTLRMALCPMLLCLAAFGCRSTSNQVLLERDLRMQEDRIYELEAMLEDCRCAREATIRENEALKRDLTQRGSGAAGAAREPAVETPAEPTPRSRKTPRDDVPKFETPQAPQIELPETPEPTPGEIAPPREEAAIEGRPAQVVFNTRMTGGLDRDGQPGHEGIQIAFELRDAAGQLVKSPGAVSVAVLDPALDGPAARVARWNFSPEKLAAQTRNGAIEHGLRFELPWPGRPPQNPELQLFVRFTTQDGEKIVADTKIDIRSPAAVGPSIERQAKTWSAAPAARRSARASDTPAKSSPPPIRRPQAAAAVDDAETDDATNPDAEIRQAAAPGRPVWKPYR